MKKQKSGGDEVLRDLFTRMEVVEPTEGFTDRVMNRIAVEKTLSPGLTRPLISRTMWIILGVLFAGLIALVLFSGQDLLESLNLDYSFNLSFVFIERYTQFINSSLTFSSSTVSYVLLGIILASSLFVVDRLFSNFRSANGA